jgi:hypothetical protein
MNPSPQDLTGSVLIVSRLIETVAKVFPSQQEKQGDEKLDEARDISHKFESVISQDDLGIIGERIIL